MATLSESRSLSKPHRYPAKHRYSLMYYANACGLAKRAEFSAAGITAALEFALSDPSRRAVDIWEDGELACRLQRDPTHVEMKS